MVVVVFRARTKPGIEAELEREDARMLALAENMPGFVSHPEHRKAQRNGRERWFSEYRITVCDVVRDYAFKA